MKKIISMYFNTKNYLKNICNHTVKHTLNPLSLEKKKKTACKIVIIGVEYCVHQERGQYAGCPHSHWFLGLQWYLQK
jgi:hypothetical protein